MADQHIVYADHAAATPLDSRVLKSMLPYMTTQFHNASATYTAGRQVHDALDAARSQAAHWLGARNSEIVFTAGGTEANNLAIHGVMRQYPGSNVVLSAIEHESVIKPAQQYEHTEVAVELDGRIKLGALKDSINDNTVLVSVMHANNEIGTIQPIREVSKIIAAVLVQRRASGNVLPLLLHTDACQSANYLDLHVARMGVDVMTINGGKLYGPKQTGLLYVKGGVVLQPLITGGGQERGLRSGTENSAGAVGLSAALELAQQQRHTETKRLQLLQQYCRTQLEIVLPQVVVNGSTSYCLPNNVHITVPGIDNERLLIQLDDQGIMAAAGSACSASNDEPSHVLRAIGLDESAAQSSIRFTFGRATAQQDIDRIISTLKKLVTNS